MGVSAETVVQNIEAGLKHFGNSFEVVGKNVQANDCGHAVTMAAEFGTVRMQLNRQSEVVSLAVGFEWTDDLATSFENATSALQVMMAPQGSMQVGESEAGQKLYYELTDAIGRARQNGTGENRFEHGGLRYRVRVEGSSVEMLVRNAD